MRAVGAWLGAAGGPQHTDTESSKAFNPPGPLMWAAPWGLQQPDLLSTLPGAGRPAWADFPSERPRAEPAEPGPGSPALLPGGRGLPPHPGPVSSASLLLT